jgi:hypothetical protein
MALHSSASCFQNLSIEGMKTAKCNKRHLPLDTKGRYDREMKQNTDFIFLYHTSSSIRNLIYMNTCFIWIWKPWIRFVSFLVRSSCCTIGQQQFLQLLSLFFFFFKTTNNILKRQNVGNILYLHRQLYTYPDKRRQMKKVKVKLTLLHAMKTQRGE